jgi:hypothetical protein
VHRQLDQDAADAAGGLEDDDRLPAPTQYGQP